ncbi:MAG: hypothetical protein HZA58_04560 [Acidimicrobiia bacterium]|nr:hypothetical protein [Acidimicrobiia bacterium]
MKRWGVVLARFGRIALAGAIAGAAAGLLWGGIGGRIAMRVIFLTSDSSLSGLQSDDDFTIGQFTSATMFLVMSTTIIGGFVGPVLALLRSAVRDRTVIVATGFAVAAGAFIGGIIVHADGIDFRLLEPLTLTVGLFVLIPAGAAFTGVFVLDHLLRPNGRIARLPAGLAMAISAFAMFPVIMFTGATVGTPLGIVVLATAISAGIGIAAFTSGDPASRLRHAAHWVVWGVLVAVTTIGVIELLRDLGELT